MDIQIGSNAIYTTTTPSLNYKIVVGGVTIYRGRALSAPNGKISVNVSQIVEDYLNSDEFPKRNISPILYSEAGGYIQTYLYRVGEEGSDTLLAQYNFLRSYDDDWQAGVYDSRQEVWTGQSITMSNPVNGRMDPRMQFLYTVYRRVSGETIDWGIVPKFRIIPDKIIASPDGGTYSLMIESNVPFTASTDSGWFTLSGAGPEYSVIVSSNSGDSRNGGVVLTFLDENDNQQTLTIPVIQAAAEISIIPSSISFGPDGGESRFTVFSNFEVTPTTTADWLTFEPVRTGDGFVTYKIVADSNRESTSGRTAYVSVRGEAMTVNQEAFAVTVVVDKTEYAWEGDEGTLTVTANGYYEITTNVEWIRVSPSVGYSGITNFEIEVDENETASARTGYITVGGTVIEITQEKQAWITITPDSWTFPATGGSVVFQISDRYNNGWQFTGTTGVLALLSQTGGTGNAQVTMTVGAATTASVTTYLLKLEDKTTGEQISLTIRRAAPVITVTPSTFNIAASGGTGTFTVYSEVNYTLNQFVSDGDWITLSATGGTAGINTFTFTADTTTSQSERRGYVRVFSTRKLTVIQEASVIEVGDYLTMEILSSGTVDWRAVDNNAVKTIEYSDDSGATWYSITSAPRPNAPSIVVSAGDTLMFRGNNSMYSWGDISIFSNFEGTAKFNLKGNILSLIYGNNFSGETSAGDFAFPQLFFGSGVVNAARLVLPSTIGEACLYGLFAGCTSLTSAPVLPSTTLTTRCYSGMFDGCTSLVNAPELPASGLAAMYCYRRMFADCTSLTTPPPTLPCTETYRECYEEMFSGCTSLTSAPVISATQVAFAACRNMFLSCTSLKIAPQLLATTLNKNCYESMFQQCTSLTTAQATLPATGLTESCYYRMFSGCSSLISAPQLPSTTLEKNCYYQMFSGCTSLTTATILPAATLADYCYYAMFFGCRKLNYIKCLATNISATYCVAYWTKNVASTGTFVKAASMNDWGSGDSGIPTGWTVINE